MPELSFKEVAIGFDPKGEDGSPSGTCALGTFPQGTKPGPLLLSYAAFVLRSAARNRRHRRTSTNKAREANPTDTAIHAGCEPHDR